MMSISTDDESSGFPIKLYSETTGDFVKEGYVRYSKDGPVVSFENGTIQRVIDDLCFTFSYDGVPRHLGIDSRIHLKPEVIVELGYTKEEVSRFHMYPPSSDKWLAHVIDSGPKAVFTVQSILGTSQKLLTIADPSSLEILHVGVIQPYESAILEMKRDWYVLNEVYSTDISDTNIYEILSKKPLSWGSLTKLIEGVSIDNLSIKKTMGETLDQIVPNSYPSAIRKQIIAFLGWLQSAEIPKTDPAVFISNYRSVGVFLVLARGHLQCLVDGVEPPKYIRLLHLADKGSLELARRPRLEAVQFDKWTQVWLKLNESFPDWLDRVVYWASRLQDEGNIVTGMPVSKKEANTSLDAWKDRFAFTQHGLLMRGNVFKDSIGLTSCVYIGAAHRWPHKHLDWSARLGYEVENPQYVQIMTLPHSAFERVARILKTVRKVDWEGSSMNLPLYNTIQKKWIFKKNLILKSLTRRRSLKQLGNEFGRWQGKKPYEINAQQAKVLDLISWDIYLSTLEKKGYSRYYALSTSTIKEELDDLHNRGIFKLHYFLIPENLRSLCIIANGPLRNICSLSRAFLKYTPSCQVRVTDKGKTSIILSRVPSDEHYDFVKELSNIPKDSELSLRIHPISAYAGYRNNLYSRLLKDDSTWDDDVSGLLNQVRLRSKDTID